MRTSDGLNAAYNQCYSVRIGIDPAKDKVVKMEVGENLHIFIVHRMRTKSGRVKAKLIPIRFPLVSRVD